MMLESLLQSIGKIKNESLFVGGRKSKTCFFEKLIAVRISSTIVEKYLLTVVIGSVKVALFSMMALGDVWFEVFSEIMFFVPFQVFFRSLIFSRKHLVK